MAENNFAAALSYCGDLPLTRTTGAAIRAYAQSQEQQQQDEQTVATELIEGPALAAGERVERGVAERMEAASAVARAQASRLAAGVQGEKATPAAPVKPRRLAAVRAPQLILLAIAAGCVLAFAWWLDATLRPALAARERHDFSAPNVERGLENTHVAPEACVASSVQWCGAIGVMAAHVRPAVQLVPMLAGRSDKGS